MLIVILNENLAKLLSQSLYLRKVCSVQPNFEAEVNGSAMLYDLEVINSFHLQHFDRYRG